MFMHAGEIVQAIGLGVAEALTTNKLFLGVEVDAFQNADIHPEYVTTVEVAKKLTGIDRQVSLETHMKELRMQANWLARVYHKTRTNEQITKTLSTYRFGKKDSQRLDILVRSSDPDELPLLVAEAKLGAQNLSGVIQDINRIVRLLTMYEELGLLDKGKVYGAVVFHSMVEGTENGAGSEKAQVLLDGVQAHLTLLRTDKVWLRAKVGLLNHGATAQAVEGYAEHHEDGTVHQVFAKDSFSFAPGLVLLGNADDVSDVEF